MQFKITFLTLFTFFNLSLGFMDRQDFYGLIQRDSVVIGPQRIDRTLTSNAQKRNGGRGQHGGKGGAGRIAGFQSAKAAQQSAFAASKASQVISTKTSAAATIISKADISQATNSGNFDAALLAANAAKDSAAQSQISIAAASELSAKPPSPTELAQISKAEQLAAASTISVN